MKSSEIPAKQTLTVACPTCGAKPGQKCELNTGEPRNNPHRDRRLAAGDEKLRQGLLAGTKGYKQSFP